MLHQPHSWFLHCGPYLLVVLQALRGENPSEIVSDNQSTVASVQASGDAAPELAGGSSAQPLEDPSFLASLVDDMLEDPDPLQQSAR